MTRVIANDRGVTLIELLIVLGFLSILMAIGSVAYFGAAADAEEARVHGDLRALATAVMLYTTQAGALPPALEDLARETEMGPGQKIGPFLMAVPRPPAGWGAAYAYARGAADSFTIAATGPQRTLHAP